MTEAAGADRPRAGVSRGEFIAIIGTVFATVAFSIDAMLPALPEIAAELSPDAPNRAQLVLTSFVLGMGVGTLLVGPISDAFGRKRVIYAGAVLYVSGATLAYFAEALEWVLAARMLQGLGAAGPRIVAIAIVRDLYSGRTMASIMSYAMLIFTIFPAVAPMIGSWIIAGFGWRSIFLAFLVFSVISVGWLGLRQPETLPRPARRPLNLAALRAGTAEALAHRQVQFSILVQSLVFSAMFGVLTTVQQSFEVTYGRAESFPYWFALVAAVAAPAAPINGWLVMRLGMRPLIRAALLSVTALSALAAAVVATGALGGAEFALFFVWITSIFALAGFTIGNLNALALEPMGHIAGLTASLLGAVATVAGAVFGSLIGQSFDGTPLPVMIAVVIALGAGALVMRRMPREAVDD